MYLCISRICIYISTYLHICIYIYTYLFFISCPSKTAAGAGRTQVTMTRGGLSEICLGEVCVVVVKGTRISLHIAQCCGVFECSPHFASFPSLSWLGEVNDLGNTSGDRGSLDIMSKTFILMQSELGKEMRNLTMFPVCTYATFLVRMFAWADSRIRAFTKHSSCAGLTPPPDRAIPVLWHNFIERLTCPIDWTSVPSVCLLLIPVC